MVKPIIFLTLFIALSVGAVAVDDTLGFGFRAFNATTGSGLTSIHNTTVNVYDLVDGSQSGNPIFNESQVLNYFESVSFMIMRDTNIVWSDEYCFTITLGGTEGSCLNVTPNMQSHYAINSSVAVFISGNITEDQILEFSGGNFSVNDTIIFVNLTTIQDNIDIIFTNLTEIQNAINATNSTSVTDELQNIFTDFGGDVGTNITAATQTSAVNFSGQTGGVTTSLVGNIINFIMAPRNTIINTFTSLMFFDQKASFPIINATDANFTTTNSSSFFGNEISLGTDEVDGHITIAHEAEDADDVAVHIETLYNGFAGATSITIDSIMSGLTTDFLSSVFLTTIDTNDTTGGIVNGVRIGKIGFGDAEVIALSVGADVDVIHQDAGTFGNMTQAFVYDESTQTYTNATGNFTNTTENLNIFVANLDSVLIGNTIQYNSIEVLLETPGGGSGAIPVFYFSNGSEWVQFTPQDTTEGFRENGEIIFEPDQFGDNWTTTSVDGSQQLFWISINRTRTGAGLTVVEQRILILETDEHFWNADGDVLIHSLNLSQDLCIDTTCRQTIWADGDHSNLTQANIETFGFVVGNHGNLTQANIEAFDLVMDNNMTVTNNLSVSQISMVNATSPTGGAFFHNGSGWCFNDC